MNSMVTAMYRQQAKVSSITKLKEFLICIILFNLFINSNRTGCMVDQAEKSQKSWEALATSEKSASRVSRC